MFRTSPALTIVEILMTSLNISRNRMDIRYKTMQLSELRKYIKKTHTEKREKNFGFINFEH